MNKLIETIPIQIKAHDMFVIHGTKCESSKSRIIMLRAMNFLTFLLEWKGWLGWWERDPGQKTGMSFPWKMPILYASLGNSLLQNECHQQQHRQFLTLASSILYRMAQEERNLGEKKCWNPTGSTSHF